MQMPRLQLTALRRQLASASLMLSISMVTACSTISTTGPSEAPVASIIAPCNAITVPAYTRAEQHQAALELAAMPAAAELRTFTRDYGVMRAAVRACHSR